jgi:uncharacterized protein YceH (UPF0502 family)
MPELHLDPIEQRVVGSLLEKERTVPATYPLTLNALRSACNQSSGRDPVMDLSESEISLALDRLKANGLARFVHAGAGARVVKFRQVLDERLSLGADERAVVTLLLLRGAQTPGELRSRSDRLHRFDDLDALERTLGALAGRGEPLVAELERRPGQKERRWIHLLGPVAERIDDDAEPPAVEPLVEDPTDGWLLVRVSAAEVDRTARAVAKALGRPVDVDTRSPDAVLDALASDDRIYLID